METTEYIWMDGQFIHWEDAKVHILTHALHYGSAVFEGIRYYKTDKGAAVFRLKEHIDRLFYSADALKMKVPFSEKEIIDANVGLIRKNHIEQGYLRPIIFYAYGKMGLNPLGAPVAVAIATWPWGKYLPFDMVDLKISKYIRIHPQSTTADAKISGHYVNSIMAVQEVQGTKYHEGLFLDFNGNIAEGPGENFFMVKNGSIFTPPLGTILAGITRRTVLELAKSEGIKTTEKIITPNEAFEADEAFFTGTAAEVTPIRSIDDHVLGSGKIGPLTQRLKDKYLDLVHGRLSEYNNWLTYVA